MALALAVPPLVPEPLHDFQLVPTERTARITEPTRRRRGSCVVSGHGSTCGAITYVSFSAVWFGGSVAGGVIRRPVGREPARSMS